MAKLLIADDSAMMRSTLRIILTEAGHTVAAEASNGYEACIEFDNHQPDLVLLDINMPFSNGIEALRSILSKQPHAKLIMVSSENCSSLISHVLNIGAMDYIIKPFSIECLLSTISKVLQCNQSTNHSEIQSIYDKLDVL